MPRALLTCFKKIILLLFIHGLNPQEEAEKRAEMEEFWRAGEEALRTMQAAKKVTYGTQYPYSRRCTVNRGEAVFTLFNEGLKS